MFDQFPDFIINRIGAPSASKHVIPGSTPVPFFGNFLDASIYTIGINPSHNEFLSSSGKLLSMKEKRLSDYETLKINHIEGLNPISVSHSEEILNSCLNYFYRKPYKWFKVLDEVVNKPLEASYFKGTACHLDLVQWATSPVWGQIVKQDATGARDLLESDLLFVNQQIHWLRRKNRSLRSFFLSGRTVVESLSDILNLEFVGKTQVDGKETQYSLYRGQYDGVPVFGTSMNVPDVHTSDSHRKFLSGWLQEKK